VRQQLARHRALLLVIAVAAAAQLAANAFHRDPISADTESYITPARNLAAGRGFLGMEPPSFSVADDPRYPRSMGPETFRTPGYPLFLACVFSLGGGIAAIILIQRLLTIGIAAAVYCFARSATGSERTALTAGLVCACFPPLETAADLVLTETLFTCVLLASVMAAEAALRRSSVRFAALAGVASACTLLIRPIALFFFVLMAAVFLIRRRPRIVLATVYLAAFSVLPAAWMLRNRSVSGVATVSASANVNSLFQWGAGIAVTEHASHWYRLTAMQRESGFRAPLHRVRASLLTRAFDLARRDGFDLRALNSTQQSRYLARIASQLIRAHPIALIELMLSAIVDMHLVEPALIATSFGIDSRVAMMLIPTALAALGFTLTGLYVLWKRNRDLALVLAATIVYFTVTSAIPEPDIRFDAVFAPEYCVALAAGLVYVRSPSRERANRDGMRGPS
jgi:hypothetical protein